jgi:hypothetical protein
MKNKLIGILICVMLLVLMLPITALGTTIASEPQMTTSGPFDRTTVYGFVLFKGALDQGKILHFFAIRLHYTTTNLFGESYSGIKLMEPVEIPSSINGYVGYWYISGTFRGSFDV